MVRKPTKAELAKRGKRSRRKGGDFERWIVRQFRPAMPGATVRRNIQASGSQGGPDVTAGFLSIQAKVGKAPPIRDALRQAKAEMIFGTTPIAVIKWDDDPSPKVFMDFDDYLEQLKELWMLRREAEMVGSEPNNGR